MKTYITIIDPHGATLGVDGPWHPISHRVLIEGKNIHGWESVVKLFDSYQILMAFLQQVSSQQSGTNGTEGNLSWCVDKQT